MSMTTDSGGTCREGVSREQCFMRELIDASLVHFGFRGLAPDGDAISTLEYLRDNVLRRDNNDLHAETAEWATLIVLIYLASQPDNVIRQWMAPWRLTA